MAEIVLGLGTSHSPQLSTPVEIWSGYEERDRGDKFLLGPDDTFWSWEALAERHAGDLDAVLTQEVWETKFAQCQTGLQALADALKAADPDVVVIIGDDQQEMFRYDNLPALGVYCGDTVNDEGVSEEDVAKMQQVIAAAAWAYHGREPEPYAVAGDLGLHLVDQLTQKEFDVTQVRSQPGGRGLGHAFTFPRRRLMSEPYPPMVPVFVNTYYPPNQPSPGRCFAFGQAIGEAVATWSGHERVAVVASGGLSHCAIDEELDREVIEGLRTKDGERLARLPRQRLQAGTSEGLNWVALGGVMAGTNLEMNLIDYVPSYRTKAGTGVGMTFATWTAP